VGAGFKNCDRLRSGIPMLVGDADEAAPRARGSYTVPPTRP
jgi:hypothetical protein